MVNSRKLVLLFAVSPLFLAFAAHAAAKLDINHGAYTSVSYASVHAPNESSLELNPRTVEVDGATALNFMDGYQFNPYLSAEIGVTHMGVATDLFSFYASLRSPIFAHISANFKYGITFANNLARKSYGGGLNVFVTAHDAVGFEYLRQYSYTQLESLNPGAGGTTYPNDWHTDIQYMQPLDMGSIKYTHFMGECNAACRSHRPAAFNKGDYVGFGPALLTRHLSHSFYRNNPLADNVGTGSTLSRDQSDDMLGFSLIHGKQITPNYGMEFGVAGSPQENYLNFYTAAARFVFPLMDEVRPFAKVGMLYTNETDFGWTMGVGADIFMSGSSALGLAWERMDTGNDAKEQYYDLATLSLRHYYGVNETEKRPVTDYSQLNNDDWMSIARKGKAVFERGLYYGLMMGMESAELEDINQYHEVDIPLDGVAGITMFGYGLPIDSHYYLGTEGFLGRSGAVHMPQTDTGSYEDDLYTQNQRFKEAYYKDYYYGWRLMAGVLNQYANLSFIHAGAVRGDFSILANSGIKYAPKYRDREGDSFFSNSAQLKGVGYMQTHGYQVGMGQEVPLTSKMFLRMEYNFTRFRDKILHPTNSASESYALGFYNDYRPKSDQFLIGVKYRMGSERRGLVRHKVSTYPSGWYANVGLGSDFHRITKLFGRPEPASDFWGASDAILFSEYNLPRSFFANGMTGEAALSRRWQRRIGNINYMVGIEGAWAVMNSKFEYHRYQDFDYVDGSDHLWPKPSLDFKYRIINKESLGLMLGYEANPEDLIYAKAHYVSSLIKRGGFESDYLPASAEPFLTYRYFGNNFSRRIEGWQFTLGNDFALNHSFGLTLSASFTRYNSFRVEDEHTVVDQAGLTTVKNNYHNYRITDMSYLMGLRYRFG